MKGKQDMRTSEEFRKLLKEPGVLMIPGAFDSLTALMVEKEGFPAVYITGSGVSLSLLGQPDLNTISYMELRQVIQNVRSTVKIPMLVDIDTGYGAPLNILRLLKDFEQLDIAAIQIEDQRMPKKCGHELGRKVVSVEEMQQRIRILSENRKEGGLVIIARTDARTDLGLEEAIKRANIYLETGADMAFVESPESYEEIKEITKRVKGPVLFNNVEGGRSPFLSKQELEAAGVKAAIYPNAQTRIITKKCSELLHELKEKGTTLGMQHEMLTHTEMFAMYNHDQWVAIENKYRSENI